MKRRTRSCTSISARQGQARPGMGALVRSGGGLASTIDWYSEFLGGDRPLRSSARRDPFAMSESSPNGTPSADDLRAADSRPGPAVPRDGIPRPGVRPGSIGGPLRGRVFDDEDIVHLVDSSLDFWLTTGRYADQFEREFARKFGVRACAAGQLGLVGQPGRPQLPDLAQAGRDAAPAGRRGHHRGGRLPDHGQPDPPEQPGPGFRRRGFADVQRRRDPARGRGRDRTRAIMIAHTLGNPFDLAGGHRASRSSTICG